jgi:ABC-type polysaccharide/polyol phosphate transport system ATPase subunit
MFYKKISMNVLLENMQSVERQLRALGCRRQARRALRTRWRTNQILIVDEVLAVGDAEFQKKCLGKMKDVAGHSRTILWN